MPHSPGLQQHLVTDWFGYMNHIEIMYELFSKRSLYGLFWHRPVRNFHSMVPLYPYISLGVKMENI
jgi:hypothetical protein